MATVPLDVSCGTTSTCSAAAGSNRVFILFFYASQFCICTCTHTRCQLPLQHSLCSTTTISPSPACPVSPMCCIGLHARTSTVEHETRLGPHTWVWQSVDHIQFTGNADAVFGTQPGVPPGWCSWRHSRLNREETLPVDRTDRNFSLLLCRSCAFEDEIIGLASVRSERAGGSRRKLTHN